MPLNPNFSLPGLPSYQPNMGMNRNPTGSGGTLGGLQPQGGSSGGYLNSTAYRPNQYNALGNTILSGPGITDWGFGDSDVNLWSQILGQQNQQNSYYNQIRRNTQGSAGMRSQILAYQKMLEQQARNTQPTSGAYYFIGGL